MRVCVYIYIYIHIKYIALAVSAALARSYYYAAMIMLHCNYYLYCIPYLFCNYTHFVYIILIYFASQCGVCRLGPRVLISIVILYKY